MMSEIDLCLKYVTRSRTSDFYVQYVPDSTEGLDNTVVTEIILWYIWRDPANANQTSGLTKTLEFSKRLAKNRSVSPLSARSRGTCFKVLLVH